MHAYDRSDELLIYGRLHTPEIPYKPQPRQKKAQRTTNNDKIFYSRSWMLRHVAWMPSTYCSARRSIQQSVLLHTNNPHTVTGYGSHPIFEELNVLCCHPFLSASRDTIGIPFFDIQTTLQAMEQTPANLTTSRTNLVASRAVQTVNIAKDGQTSTIQCDIQIIHQPKTGYHILNRWVTHFTLVCTAACRRLVTLLSKNRSQNNRGRYTNAHTQPGGGHAQHPQPRPFPPLVPPLLLPPWLLPPPPLGAYPPPAPPGLAPPPPAECPYPLPRPPPPPLGVHWMLPAPAATDGSWRSALATAMVSAAGPAAGRPLACMYTANAV